MFAFNVWAGWLKTKADVLGREGVVCVYSDTISNPECARNPGFSIEVEGVQRVGRLCFWRGGTCDFEVLDTSTRRFVANVATLEANDQTVPVLFAQFISFFGPSGK